MSIRAPARRLLLLGGAPILIAALLIPFTLLPVPSGSIGLTGGRLYEAGWHFKVPFAPARVVPVTGGPVRFDIDRSTPEGATIRIRISLDYRITPAAIEDRADAIGTLGFDRFLGRVTREALEPLPASTLLAPATPAGGTGRARLPRVAIEAIETALRSTGIDLPRLDAWVGPTRAFAPLGAEPVNQPDVADGPMPPIDPTGIRLLLIGLDGADWEIIDPLLRDGRMPHLAALIQNGARGRMRSYDPMISPLLWTTMVTGVGPDRHRIADFQAIDTATGRRVPITSRFRGVKALWNILGDAGLTTGFIAWWASYPVEKVSGVQVSNLVAFETLRPREAGSPIPAGIIYPANYLEGVRDVLMTVDQLTFEEARSIMRIDRQQFRAAVEEVLRRPGPNDESLDRKMLQRPVPLALSILTGSRNYAAIATDLAARRFDLTAVYFEGIDMMGHRFQHCMPPRIPLCPDEDFARFGDTVTAYYVRQDRLIGEILKAAGPDATVMVVSDHGFKSGSGRPREALPFTTQQPVEWHEEEGIFLLSGPAARAGARLATSATLFDLTPTILYMLGLPVADDMPGRILREAFDPTFTRIHQATTVPTYEGLGHPREFVVAEGAAARQAEDELLANLRALGYVGGDAGTASQAGVGSAPGPDDADGLDRSSGGEHRIETLAFYHRNLAIYFLKRREIARAVDELLAANARQKLPKTYQLLSQAYMSLERTDEAMAALHEGLLTFPAMDPESVLWLVRIRLNLADGIAAARDEARRWADRTSGSPGLDDTIAGLLAQEEGSTTAAAGFYREALSRDPTRVVAAQRLYELEDARGQAASLEPILRLGLAQDDRIDEYHNLLGVILVETGRREESLRSLRRAVTLDPYNARFAGNLAGVLARLARWEEAATVYSRAAQLAPTAETYMRLGSVYRRLRQPERALAAFRQARDTGDGGGAPFLGIALTLADLGRGGEAAAAAREGLDQHPDDRALQSFYEDLLRKKRTPGSAPGRSG